MNDKGLGVALDWQSTKMHAGSTAMSCNKNYNPMTKDNTTHAQVTKSKLERKEEINSLQQHHNIDGLMKKH